MMVCRALKTDTCYITQDAGCGVARQKERRFMHARKHREYWCKRRHGKGGDGGR